MKSGRVISGEAHEARAEAKRLLEEARAEAERLVEDARRRASELESAMSVRIQQRLDEARAELERLDAQAQHARAAAAAVAAGRGAAEDGPDWRGAEARCWIPRRRPAPSTR